MSKGHGIGDTKSLDNTVNQEIWSCKSLFLSFSQVRGWIESINRRRKTGKKRKWKECRKKREWKRGEKEKERNCYLVYFKFKREREEEKLKEKQRNRKKEKKIEKRERKKVKEKKLPRGF